MSFRRALLRILSVVFNNHSLSPHTCTFKAAYSIQSTRTLVPEPVNRHKTKGAFISFINYSNKMSDSHVSRKVAVCQLTAKNNKDENFDTCKGLIESAVREGVKVVFLPEGCDYIGDSKDDAVNLSEPLDGKIISKYKELAKNLKVWLSLGGIHEKADDSKVRNAHVIINDNGEIASVYRKLHLFDVDIPEKNIRLKESEYVICGNEIVKPVQSPVGEIGLAICYDLRFPELSQTLRNMGAKILTYPSAFTFATGSAHWEILLRSRAIETQCYVIAAAQTGSHNKKRMSWGHAMIIDPSGTIVAQCSEGTGFAIANINLELLNSVRKSIPTAEHKRTDLYPKMMPIADGGSKVHEGEICRGLNEVAAMATDELNYQFGQVIIPENNIFYKTGFTMAFVNKRCVVPGHVLVAPLRPALRLVDLTQTEVSDLFLVVQRVEKVMEDVHKTASTTIAVQDGPDAGRTILHLHVHILPRKQGDFLQNDQIYYELQQHDKSEDKPWRSPDEMSNEAAMLSNYFKQPTL